MEQQYIGIITATIEEFEAIKNIMNQIEEIKHYDLIFYKGKINSKNIVLVKCGVGKVNAARTTQILTDKFNVKSIINVGSAGGLNNNLEIGDIVIGKELVQHDFDITPFGHEKGYITDTGRFFKCDEKLINTFKNVKIQGIKVITGIIASGDIFCTDAHMKEKIKEKKIDILALWRSFITPAVEEASTEEVILNDSKLSETKKKELLKTLNKCDTIISL